MAFRMHARHNNDSLAVNSEEETVRETAPAERPTCFAVKNWEGVRMNPHQIHRCSRGIEKLMAKPRSLLFVPEIRVFDVGRGGRSNDDFHHRERPSISLRTRVHGMPVGPSRSISSSRRSSSRRCHSVNGTADGSAARLSHTSSSSRSFCSGVRSSRFSAGFAIPKVYVRSGSSPVVSRLASLLMANAGRILRDAPARGVRKHGP